MPTVRLEAAVPTANDYFYLDASCVFSLGQSHLQRTKALSAPPQELQRAARLTPFIGRAVAVASTVMTSPFSLEEIAALVRNRVRSKASGGQRWAVFKQTAPAAATAADQDAHSQMLAILSGVADSLNALGVAVMVPEVVAGSGASAGQALRQLHRTLLKKHPSLDSGDAFHVALGAAMGATGYVTFDTGWSVIPHPVIC